MINEDARTRAQEFADEVEAALASLPEAQRAELTRDLVDHLLERGDDGRRPIDESLDPLSYAEELQATASPSPARAQRARPRLAYVLGTGLVGVAMGVGTWLVLAQPWTVGADQSPPAPTATASASAQIRVQDVRGLSQAEAVSALESKGFTVDLVMLSPDDPLPGVSSLESGQVAYVDPFPGTLVDEGSAVAVMVIP